ncbi:TPA: DUF4368 domain-containing protein, partial [Clostridioides difficile]|nr:DUF4368 domain-containing protein [Clostridioides difficile]
YIDDGWSGTNFERPSFQRMIEDIEAGKINCVVTKDLSRLGRNYIMTGQYTELYFPSHNVRYIAIDDGVDSEKGESEIDRLFAKMYEDRACEKITERNFIMLSGKYQKEQIELEQQITNLREELSKMEQDMIGAERWIELIKEYSVPKELTAPLLNAMIEKILIHEATTNEENERIQEIEIYYRFIGKVD